MAGAWFGGRKRRRAAALHNASDEVRRRRGHGCQRSGGDVFSVHRFDYDTGFKMRTLAANTEFKREKSASEGCQYWLKMGFGGAMSGSLREIISGDAGLDDGCELSGRIN